MAETTGVNVLQNAENVQISPPLNGYSGVRIYVGTDDDGNEIVYQAGSMEAQVLDIKNPFGTQTMADNILASILGYQYQPLIADGALLDPAAELGDGVTVNSVYSGIFTRATKFGALMASDISAPTNEEIEHEYAVESPSDRQYTRFVQQTKATISITATQIRAEMVTKEGGDTQTFGWVLTSAGHKWYSGSQTVMQIDQNGLKVKGQIEVGTSIGSTNGFTISANAIYKNISQFNGTQNSGVYIGTDGIQLGQGFKVDSTGNLTASSGTFTGQVSAGSIQYGGTHGTFNGAGITGGSIGTPKLDSTGQNGVDGGNAFRDWFKFNATLNDYIYNGTTLYAPYIKANSGLSGPYYIGNAGGGQMRYRTLYFQPLNVSGFDSYGNPKTITANFVTVTA